ncbi:TetR/AcrR family transcriptional regulator [Deinococcus ruber]|uniref:HTH tetR-type domain-containing protein n=1 Tax=Deinococcus ruber TaxID=1848197 RepID=A0A918CPT8_9DEIO|nr:TetR/AcrR family transcriptional regulator [Deinococcus ruber]GGR34412.1 hypothetical protein GCM10008957_50710 [Deinococcus ruber]
MTSPDSPRARAKRQQIVDAARQLFLKQGYARSTTDAITQAAGVSKQTLYVYFPGKMELLAAVLAAELDGLEEQPGNHAPPQNAEELRAALLHFALSVTARLLCPDAIALLRLLVGEAAQLPELRGVLRRALPAVLLERVEALLKTCAAQSFIAVPDPDLSARMFVGPVMSFVALDGLFGEVLPALPLEATLTALVDLFLLTVSVERTTHDSARPSVRP